MNKISIKEVRAKDKNLIRTIAHWYHSEWSIPVDYTFKRLSAIPNEDVIFQLVLSLDLKLIATGGLYKEVGLIKKHPKFSTFSPWVALLYTDAEFRNQGFGKTLLHEIEILSEKLDLKKIYLHTFSAEKFYLKYNWNPIDKATYKGHTTVVMEKYF